MTHNTSATGDPSERQVPACDSLGHVSNATLEHERAQHTRFNFSRVMGSCGWVAYAKSKIINMGDAHGCTADVY